MYFSCKSHRLHSIFFISSEIYHRKYIIPFVTIIIVKTMAINIINEKMNNFIIFVDSIYNELNIRKSDKMTELLATPPIQILASLKVLINTHDIQSDKQLFDYIKEQLSISDDDFNKLSLAHTGKLLRYCSYFYDLSKIL